MAVRIEAAPTTDDQIFLPPFSVSVFDLIDLCFRLGVDLRFPCVRIIGGCFFKYDIAVTFGQWLKKEPL